MAGGTSVRAMQTMGYRAAMSMGYASVKRIDVLLSYVRQLVDGKKCAEELGRKLHRYAH
jgi:hypothetical protein